MKKTSKLVEIIKETVREVVREELRAVLGKKPLTKENIKHGMSLVDIQNSPTNPYEQGTKPPKRKDFTFSSDPAINKILNETANSQRDEEWKTMGNKEFNRADARSGLASMMGYGDTVAQTGKPSIEQMMPNDRKHVSVDSKLADVLTRDYSELVKKMNEKK
jgi:hypothetical protein